MARRAFTTGADSRARYFVEGAPDGRTAWVRHGKEDTTLPPEELFKLIVGAVQPGEECIIFFRKESK